MKAHLHSALLVDHMDRVARTGDAACGGDWHWELLMLICDECAVGNAVSAQ